MLVTIIKAVSLTYLIGAVALTISAGAWYLVRPRLAPQRRAATGFVLIVATTIMAFGCSVYIFWGVVTFRILMTTPNYHLLMTGGWAAVITACGFAVFLASMLIGFISYLRGRLPRVDAEVRQLENGLAIRFVDRVSTACVIGVVRPEIWVNPAYWNSLDEDQRNLALVHEKTHISRRDNLVKLLIGYIGTLYAALPWIRGWSRNYELDSELAVDACCRHSCDEKGYIRLVSSAVAHVLEQRLSSATSSLNQADLRLRLKLLNQIPHSAPGIVIAYLGAVVVAFVSVAPVAVLLMNSNMRCMLACYLGY